MLQHDITVYETLKAFNNFDRGLAGILFYLRINYDTCRISIHMECHHGVIIVHHNQVEVKIRI